MTGVSTRRAGRRCFYQVKSRMQFPRHARDLFLQGQLLAARRGRLHRHLSSLQGRPRAQGQLLQPGSGHQRLPLPESRRRARMGGRSLRGHARKRRLPRRTHALHAPDGAAGAAGWAARPRHVRRRTTRTSTLRRSASSTSCAASGSLVVRRARTCSSGRSAPLPIARAMAPSLPRRPTVRPSWAVS